MLSKLIPVGLLAAAAWANVINDVREAACATIISRWAIPSFRSTARSQGVTPEMIEALSWMGRGALAAKQLDKADVIRQGDAAPGAGGAEKAASRRGR